MKSLFTLLLVTILLESKSQDACSKTIFNCNADMRLDQFPESSIRTITNISYAKPGSSSIAPDASYEEECWQGVACKKDGANLRFDVYYPSSQIHDYSKCKLPVIFLIHPGGFSECSSKDQPGIILYSKELAKRGFVVFNVEYRRGHKIDPNYERKSASYILSMYRGFQDLRGAIRSAIDMQANGLFTQFSFDTSYIFLGGAGTVPMNTAYYNQQMMDDILPELSKALGPLNTDYYYGDTTITYRIKGVMNLWGSALATTKEKFLKHFENRTDLAPLISFHGVLDENSRYDFEDILFSKAPYNADNTCLADNASPFILANGNDDVVDMKTYGSQCIYGFIKHYTKIPTELYLDCNMHHGLDDNSGFGIGTTDIPTVQKYIIQRVATFFQAVVTGRANRLKTDRFVNCENFRFGCNAGDNNNNCNADSNCADVGKSYSYKTPVARPIFTIAQGQGNTICIRLKDQQTTEICIFDLNGICIKKIKSSTIDTYIDLPQKNNGVYLIQVNNGQVISSKLFYHN